MSIPYAGKQRQVCVAFTVALLFFFLSGCGGETIEEVSALDIGAPPSVRQVEQPSFETIRLEDEQAGDLDIQVFRVERSDLSYSLSIPGTVFPAPEHVAIVSAPISGRIVQVHAHEGEWVRDGQVLLELESLEFAGLVADYMQAQAEEKYQNQQLDRLQQLVEQRISPMSALEKVQADQVRAGVMVQSALARLRAVGVTTADLDAWLTGQAERPLLRVRSPISGIIDRHLIDLGQAVASYEEMMSIINPEQVLIRGYVSPEDASLVKPGNPVRVTVKELPDRIVEAKVLTINPALDEVNKSVTVNILARTQDSWPLPGQNVRVELLVRSPQPVLMIPLAAVQYEGQNAAVFVRRDSLTFEKRFVQTGRLNDQDVVVSAGLEEGDEVAVSQIFSLKALSRFDQFAEE